jgi:ketosteroid isomerase-like protein
MSQENVEVVRAGNEALNRGDIEGFLAFYSEDVEAEDLMNAPDVPRVVDGIQAFRQMLKAWVDTFDDFRADIVEFIDAGHQVVCVTDYSGKGREGLTTNLRVADVFEVRSGKVVRATLSYSSREEALEAVGLSE